MSVPSPPKIAPSIVWTTSSVSLRPPLAASAAPARNDLKSEPSRASEKRRDHVLNCSVRGRHVFAME